MIENAIIAPVDDLLSRFAPVRPVHGVPEIVVHQARDVFALWQAWEEKSGGRRLPPPFWATVWPAAAVLARAVLDDVVQVRGRRVLEIGCGGAVAAIAAARAGASAVEANDIDAVALYVASRNAAANSVALQLTALDHSRAPAIEADVVLAADLFYEREVSERLLERLQVLRRHGGEVFVADGGRPFAPRAGIALVLERRIEVDADLEGGVSRLVRVLRLA